MVDSILMAGAAAAEVAAYLRTQKPDCAVPIIAGEVRLRIHV